MSQGGDATQGSFICRKILHRTSGFTSYPKESVLRICIAIKNPTPRPGLNPRPLEPVESTLTTNHRDESLVKLVSIRMNYAEFDCDTLEMID
jgi:hypothetical protein